MMKEIIFVVFVLLYISISVISAKDYWAQRSIMPMLHDLYVTIIFFYFAIHVFANYSEVLK